MIHACQPVTSTDIGALVWKGIMIAAQTTFSKVHAVYTLEIRIEVSVQCMPVANFA